MTVALVRFLSRSGARLLLLASALCVGVAVVLPGQSIGDRLKVFILAVLAIALAYAFFRIVLTLVVSVGEQFSGRLVFWYTALVLYGGIVATPLVLLSLPFHWRDLYGEGMTGPLHLASVPSSLAASLAAARVIEKHYVAA